MTDKVILKEDVVFGTTGERDLLCDVFVPPGSPESAEGAPAVLLVHGGAWVMGDKTQLRGYGFLLGREGIVCVASEYRLAAEAKWPAQIHDVKAALRWMRANAADLGINPQKIAICGASSGAHLALIAAGTSGQPELEGQGGNADYETSVAAAISFYGPTLLEPGGEMLHDSVVALLGENAAPETFRQASPISHLSEHFPPTLLLHSNQDELVPRQQCLAFCEKLFELGVPVELSLFDNVPHMFDANKRLGRQAASMVHSFIERYLVETDT